MAVLDLAAGFGYVVHAFPPEVVELGKGLALMVAFLVRGGEGLVFFRNYVVLKLSHCLELQARACFKGFLRPGEGCVRAAVKSFAVLGVEAAQQAQCGNLVERIHKCGAVAGDYVQVTVACLYE